MMRRIVISGAAALALAAGGPAAGVASVLAVTRRGARRGIAAPRRLVAAVAALLIVAPFLASLSVGSAASASTRAATLSAAALQAAPKVPIGARPLVPAADRAVGTVATAASETGAVVVRPRDEQGLAGFISSVTAKGSAMYHRYLARGQFQSRFGPAGATIATVEQALRAEGLTVAGVSGDGLLVTFRGSAASVEHAFGTGLERYRLPNGTIGQATTGSPRVPAPIARSVAGIVGLDELGQEQPQYVIPRGTAMSHGFAAAKAASIPNVAGAPTPCTDAQQDAESSGGLTDDQIANAYGAFGLYKAGDFGAGQHIAVFELEPFLDSDIQTFDTCYFGATEAGQMLSRLSVIPVDGGQPSGPGSDEAVLDVEDVSAMAPGADIDVYEAPNTTFGTLDEYAAIVNDDTDDIVTSSWAVCEQLAQYAEPGLQQAENFLFEQAAAQGQTVLSAAGDTGDDECNEYRDLEPPAGQNLLSVLDPSSQPYVVAAGGTTIDDATQPPSEHVWNDGAEWGAGGGGVSESWQMPGWQQAVANTKDNSDDVANAESVESAHAASEAPFATPTFCDGTLGLTPGTPCRETPDVSAQADEFTGSVTIYGVSLGYGNPDGWATIGGTSSASPIWAAMLALVNASSSCRGETVNGIADTGFASPILYGIAANPAAYAASFNDITSGNNDLYGLDNGLVFPARADYDMASGLGSPQLTTASGGNGLAFYMCQYGAQLRPPAVAGLIPAFGSTAAGDTIVVKGSGFGTAATPLVARVSVGGGSATSFTVAGNSTLLVTLPAADTTTPAASPNPTEDGAGPVQIVVTGTSGQSSVPSASSLFEYVDENTGRAAPSVTSLSPYGGLDTNPAKVTVFGSGFVPGATVHFGGVAGTDVTVVSPFEITVKPPPFSALTPGTACPTDTGAAGQPLNPADDICQVEVTVTEGGQTSRTAAILPPYEGPLSFDSMGGEILPANCGCEDEPQTTEYDYVPLPSVASTSTGTPATLPGTAADLASEYGGAPSNVVTVTGTGLDPLTLSYATLGLPVSEYSIYYPVQDSGTFMVLVAPALIPSTAAATTEPVGLPVGASSIAGLSTATADIYYAGIPTVTSVVNTATGKNGVPDSQACPSPPPASGCGTPLSIAGSGFLQATGPLGFVDHVSPFDLATQYNYTQVSDTSITTQSVQQNPALVDVEVCTSTGCSYNPPDDLLYVYPPGNPELSAITPASGPAQGGNQAVITGANLGCATGVFFGTVAAETFSNAEALLDCGTTNQVDVTVPPGTAGSTVSVTVSTVESGFTGSKSNSVSYSYTDSPPSAPTSFTVTPGRASATLRWSPPASDGGSKVSGYIARASSPGRATATATLPASATSHIFAALHPGVSWSFSVLAVSSRGDGRAATWAKPVKLAPGDNGYLVATANGGRFGFGSLSSDASPRAAKLAAPIAGIAATADGLGYFEVTSRGTVTSFGDARFHGSATLSQTHHVVGIAATPDGGGYWLLLNTGTVQAFGDARNYGGANQTGGAVGIAATADGKGYYIAERNGNVTARGDATFSGDEAGKHLTEPIAGIAVDPVAAGYWLVGAQGAVYAFGKARNHGSESTTQSKDGAAGIAATPDGNGYWLLAPDGKVFSFGTARYEGDPALAQSTAVGIVTA
jgi:Pro-kumamolisin, activation domain/Fibronectin type III domain/IPT/TIG domain